MKNNCLFILLLTISLALNAKQQTAEGLVFWDKNKNHIFDQTDEPLSGVAVSSLDTIVLSKADGTFSIPLQTNDIVFVIQPDSFQSPLMETGIPGFYRLCYSKTSPRHLHYSGIETKSILNDSLCFPLEKYKP
ncbi:MAG: hypothetical protein JW798_02295, partial [Prolixibacteraceae bacterium]|nr:hypothetical protein [Prolixibacteraceae bacterium]